MKSSLVFLRLLRFSQQRHPLRQSLSPRDVLRRVETVGSGFRLRGEALRKGAQPPASQPLVLLGVCVGLALAAAPLAFKSVRQREQSVAEMRDAQYAGDGKDAARDDRLKGRPNKSR